MKNSYYKFTKTDSDFFRQAFVWRLEIYDSKKTGMFGHKKGMSVGFR